MKQLHLNLYKVPWLDIIIRVSVNLWKTLYHDASNENIVRGIIER